MSMRNGLIGALLATAAMASVASAQGQGQQQMPMMGAGQNMMGYGMGPGMTGWGMQGMMGPGMHGMMGQGYGPMMEGRLAYLKAELGITDAQTDAWNGYVSAVQTRATTMQSMHATMMQAMQTGSALERMQAHTQAMQSMVESLKALLPATEALYKVLGDDQKKKADLLLGMGCCMM
ncbi:MAG: Spy/CpxP family protein refolding chaperone [Hyphomicrobium sp.]|uniref:Spy/CpxP family protein refolding chaperone n=1 Tax=Hyphomicrobium sp. TaxID=82 RepID=UPI003D0F47A3